MLPTAFPCSRHGCHNMLVLGRADTCARTCGVQCNAMQRNALHHNTIQCNATQCNAPQCTTIQCTATPRIAMLTMKCNTMQRNATQRNAITLILNNKQATMLVVFLTSQSHAHSICAQITVTRALHTS
eukprot:9613197-Lingulodinium_polyedra.AAC.1